VANDTTPNQLYLSRHSSPADTPRLIDQATASGVAFNQQGKSEGCMGIAVDDIDQNGLPDLLITNFLYETNTLYLSQQPGLFTDATQPLGIAAPSRDVLGFGTQFFDANLDGQPELFVANGHIDDLSRNGRPYRMPPQLFTFDGRQFNLIPSTNLGPYFESQWLGRAVARIDWNRDGREDLLVGHLHDPTQILINQTPTNHHYLALRLVGTECARDPIGARVTLVGDGWKRHAQLTSGDGYQAKNENRLLFGLGELTNLERVEVRWPSAPDQPESFPITTVDQEVLLIQNSTAIRGTSQKAE
jgi:hypothetical protein